MKSKKIYISSLFLSTAMVLFTLNSCDESFLEPDPLSFYSPNNVLIDEEGLQAVLDKALSSLRGELFLDQSPFLTNMKYSDVGVDGSTDKATPWQDLNNQMLPDGENNSNAVTKIGWYWDASYQVIKDCNTVISRIDATDIESEETKNRLIGSAYFLRSYRYYAKTLQYGDVPLILEELKEPRVDFYTTTKESIWPKMIKDLEFAVQWVPEASQVANGQVTKAACKHLLAKYYLLEGRFDDAIKQTSDIIDGGVHNLMTNRFGIDQDIPEKDVIWDLFREENKSHSANTEGLMLTIDRYGMDGNTGYRWDGLTNGTGSMRNALPMYGQTGIIKTPDGANGMTDQAGVEIGLVETYGRGIARVRPSGYSIRDVWVLNGVMDWTD
ncbi:MAG: RagB/SusD family nutrient uptake outer membrane protein, partial [Bacteroidetes bacterium]